MKKIISLLIVAAMLAGLSACSGKTENSDSADTPGAQAAQQDFNAGSEALPPADLDLTAMNGTMVYSQVYNMVTDPDSFLGKTVRMNGNFAYSQNPDSGRYYFACLIADATACCSQGIEFVVDGKATPTDFTGLEAGSEITVQGIFDSYEEDGNTYFQLIGAKLL